MPQPGAAGTSNPRSLAAEKLHTCNLSVILAKGHTPVRESVIRLWRSPLLSHKSTIGRASGSPRAGQFAMFAAMAYFTLDLFLGVVRHKRAILEGPCPSSTALPSATRGGNGAITACTAVLPYWVYESRVGGRWYMTLKVRG